MFSTSILETAIGLIFVYLLMSLICSAINEIIESFLKNRSTDLERGIRELFNHEGGGQMVANFYKHPLINGLFRGVYGRETSEKIGPLDYLKPTNLPSYIPARNFSFAVLDLLLHPPANPFVTRDDAPPPSHASGVEASVLPVSMDAIRLAIRRNLDHTQVGRALRTLAEQSGDDVNAMRVNTESWFNGAMDRVSGSYKRRTKWIIFALGLTFTILLNVNTVTIAKRLSNDATLRSVIIARAEGFTSRPGEPTPNFEENRKELELLGLPLGWPSGIVLFPSPFNIWDHILLPLIGWLLTASAISLGAPFWFDLLNKFMVIRSTVKPHEKSPEEDSEDRQLIPENAPGAAFLAAGTRFSGAGTPAGLRSLTNDFQHEVPASPEPEYAAGPDPDDNESEIDGCSVEIVEATPDEELPPAKGGVA